MRLGGPSLPVERVSATSLATYIGCAERYRQRYVLRQKERLGGERFIGSVTHKALQSLFDRNFYENTDGSPEAAVSSAWESVIEREGDPDWREGEDATEMYRRARRMLTAYAPIALEKKPVAVEQRFEETIAGVTVVGYIDQELDDRILEIKTAGQKVTKPKSGWQLQGRLYSLISGKAIEWTVITRQSEPKIYMAEDYPELYVARFNPDTTVNIIEQTINSISDTYARYGRDQPWPTNGMSHDWLCSRCQFKKNSCPAWAHERNS